MTLPSPGKGLYNGSLMASFDHHTLDLHKASLKGYRKFWSIGNAGVGLMVCRMLEKLGYRIEYRDYSSENQP